MGKHPNGGAESRQEVESTQPTATALVSVAQLSTASHTNRFVFRLSHDDEHIM